MAALSCIIAEGSPQILLTSIIILYFINIRYIMIVTRIDCQSPLSYWCMGCKRQIDTFSHHLRTWSFYKTANQQHVSPKECVGGKRISFKQFFMTSLTCHVQMFDGWWQALWWQALGSSMWSLHQFCSLCSCSRSEWLVWINMRVQLLQYNP